jgi:hypothetical protein
MLPYTIEQMLTAVPSRPVTLLIWRYLIARSVPRAEHRVDGEIELLHRILREGLLDLLQVDLLVNLAQLLELVGGQVGVFLGAVLLLQRAHFHFEVVVVRPVVGPMTTSPNMSMKRR